MKNYKQSKHYKAFQKFENDHSRCRNDNNGLLRMKQDEEYYFEIYMAGVKSGKED